MSRTWSLLHLVTLATVSAANAQPRPQRPFLTDLAFSNDSTLVAACGDKVRVFDVATGRAVREYDVPLSRSIAFSPAAKTLLAVGSRDGVVRLFDTTKPDAVRELKGHDGSVDSIAFDPTGRWMASASERYENKGAKGLGQFRLWDAEAGKELRRIEVPGGAANGVVFSPDGSLVAFCRNARGDAAEPSAEVYKVAAWTPAASVKLTSDLKGVPFGLVTRFLPGNRLQIGGGVCVPVTAAEAAPYPSACRTTGLLWEADLGDKAKLVEAPRMGYYRHLSPTPDGKRYATGGAARPRQSPQVEMRESDGNKVVWTADGDQPALDLLGVRVSPDGKLATFLRGGWGEIRLLDASDGKPVRTIKIGG